MSKRDGMIKVVVRSITDEWGSEHFLPPSEIAAFIEVMRAMPIYHIDHDPEICEITPQWIADEGLLELVVGDE